MTTLHEKFDIQESEYVFPYHYIPHFDCHGVPMRSQTLGWGFDYLCYLKHIASLVLERNPSSVLDVGPDRPVDRGRANLPSRARYGRKRAKLRAATGDGCHNSGGHLLIRARRTSAVAGRIQGS